MQLPTRRLIADGVFARSGRRSDSGALKSAGNLGRARAARRRRDGDRCRGDVSSRAYANPERGRVCRRGRQAALHWPHISQRRSTCAPAERKLRDAAGEERAARPPRRRVTHRGPHVSHARGMELLRKTRGNGQILR